MLNRTRLHALSLLIPVLLLAILIPNAFARQSCYIITNFAVPNYVNLTLNGTKFMIRLNFIGPNSAGITINETKSFTLLPNQSQVVMNTVDYAYSSALINVSWLPVEHTVSINFCSTPNFQVTSTTVPSTSTSSASTTAATTSILLTSTIASTAPTTTTGSLPVIVTQSPAPNLLPDAVLGVIVIVLAVLYFVYRAYFRK